MLIIGPVGLILLILIIVAVSQSGKKTRDQETEVRAAIARVRRESETEIVLSDEELIVAANQRIKKHQKKGGWSLLFAFLAMIGAVVGAAMDDSGLLALVGLAVSALFFVRVIVVVVTRPKIDRVIREVSVG